MEAAPLSEIKKELSHRSITELQELLLAVGRYKKENKELLTYLLFEREQEDLFIGVIQEEVNDMFDDINTASYYYIKKSVRKIIRHIRKHIRYSKKPETEAALWQHFLECLAAMSPNYRRDKVLTNIYERQEAAFKKALSKLHPDKRGDFMLD